MYVFMWHDGKYLYEKQGFNNAPGSAWSSDVSKAFRFGSAEEGLSWLLGVGYSDAWIGKIQCVKINLLNLIKG